MNIGYVTTYDAKDVRNWSGTGYYIAKALELQDNEIEYIGSLDRYHDLNIELKKITCKLMGKRYLDDRNRRFLEYYARQVKEKLLQSDAEVIFSPGTMPICCLKTKKPIVFWTDATFAGMVSYYPEWFNLSKESVRNGHRMEQAALDNCSLAIYASEWAAETAINNYDVNPSKVKVIPFGANIDSIRDINTVLDTVARRSFGVCSLLFIGVDWTRKGGDIAVALAQKLKDAGLSIELNIVGCFPPVALPDFVKIRGFISKADQAGRDILDSLFAKSHFLIFPSRAECYGLVSAEANAYGVPAIASDRGGIPTVVKDGVNGRIFSLEEYVDKATKFIIEHMNDHLKYALLCQNAYYEFLRRLNWRAAGTELMCLLRNL